MRILLTHRNPLMALDTLILSMARYQTYSLAPRKNDTVDISTDCNGAVLAPGLVDMRVQSADPGLNI